MVRGENGEDSMMEVALSKADAQNPKAPDGYRIISRGTKWIVFGIGAGFLMSSLLALVPQPSFAPKPLPGTLSPIYLPSAMMIVVGLNCWLIGGIHYAREVWKS